MIGSAYLQLQKTWTESIDFETNFKSSSEKLSYSLMQKFKYALAFGLIDIFYSFLHFIVKM